MYNKINYYKQVYIYYAIHGVKHDFVVKYAILLNNINKYTKDVYLTI